MTVGAAMTKPNFFFFFFLPFFIYLFIFYPRAAPCMPLCVCVYIQPFEAVGATVPCVADARAAFDDVLAGRIKVQVGPYLASI